MVVRIDHRYELRSSQVYMALVRTTRAQDSFDRTFYRANFCIQHDSGTRVKIVKFKEFNFDDQVCAERYFLEIAEYIAPVTRPLDIDRIYRDIRGGQVSEECCWWLLRERTQATAHSRNALVRPPGGLTFATPHW